MSKLWKGVKKVFKKVVKFVKKYWVYIAIAVAVYFTAGVALSAMPSTASFAGAMPGFGVGGMFSNAAVAMGATGAAGSGIAGTVAANAAAAAAGSAAAAGAAGGMSAAAGGSGLGAAGGGAGFVMPGATASAGSAAGIASSTAAGTAGGAVGAAGAASGVVGAAAVPGTVAAAGAATKTAAAVAGMSGLEKVALASTVFKGVGGLLSDSEDDINKKQHNRMYGQSYGIGRDGTGPGYTGLVKDTFGDKYGGTKGTSGQQAQGETPFDGGQAQAQSGGSGATPFDNQNQLAQQNAPKREYINSGYKNKNYSGI